MQNQLQPESLQYNYKLDPIQLAGDPVTEERMIKSVEKLNLSLEMLTREAFLKNPAKKKASHQMPLPELLQGKALIVLLANLPEDEVGELLYMKIKEFLDQKNKHHLSVLKETPSFYPDNKQVSEISDEKRKIIDNEMDMMGVITQSIVLFHHYTGNLEYISSRTFEIHLAISRFWASLLSGWFKVKNLPFEPGEKINNLCSLASRFLELSLKIINYMKAENAWTYKDLKEKNRFSEIRETAIWNEFITAESKKASTKTGKQETGLVIESLNQSTENKDADFLYNFIINIAGMDVTEKGLYLLPVLPEFWKSWRMKLHFRKVVLNLYTEEEHFHIENVSNSTVMLTAIGQEMTILAGESKTIKLY